MQHVKMKRRVLVALSVVLALAGGILCIAAVASALFDRISESLDVSPQRLVYHTDHAAILRACREVLADPQAAGFPKTTKGYSMVSGSQSGMKPPAALPAVLRDLNFEFMDVEDDRATIFFGSGFGHWGYSTVPAQGNSQLELIPGLWFWSEDRLPRDSSKFPYYRTSKRILLGGVVALAVAIVLVIHSRRSATSWNTSRNMQ